MGIRVSRKRVERLMRLAGITGVHRRKATGRRPKRVGEVSADLVDRQFDTDRPDRLWMADITEHPTRGGTVYLAVVLDAWNREIIGWSIANHLRAEIVCDAFEMARWKRRPQPGTGLIHHSDQGTQGRFNRSLQHLEMEVFDGQASWMDEGVDGSVADEVAGGAVGSEGDREGVLV